MRTFASRVVRRSAVSVLSLLAATNLIVQIRPQAPPIKVSTHLVQFSVTVRDKRGPVDHLTKDDFVVLDRGKPQTVSVFSTEGSELARQPQQPLPPGTFSDMPQYRQRAPRSVTIILLDNLNTLFGSEPQPYEDTPHWLEDHALGSAKRHLVDFLKQMDPVDRVAIYGLTDRLRVLCDFTCDRDQLLAVVSQYDASSKTAREEVDPQDFHLPNVAESFNQAIDEDTRDLAGLKNRQRASITMSALVSISAHVSELPGRKNLLWLTANLPFSGEAIARVLARGNLVVYPVDVRGLLPRAVITVDENSARTYAEGQSTLNRSPAPVGIDTMEDMAADTGGRAFVNTNDLTAAIRSVVEDSSVTYTLGFYLPAQEVDGKFHKLTVQVKQSGVSVAYPRGYFAYEDTNASEKDSLNSFLAAMRSPLDSSAVPLDVRLSRVDRPLPHSIQIVGVAGIAGVQLAQYGGLRHGALNIYAVEQNAAGDVLHQMNQRLKLNISEEQYRAYLRSGILFRGNVPLQPGATVLRVLVQDPGTSEVGCVIVPLAKVK